MGKLLRSKNTQHNFSSTLLRSLRNTNNGLTANFTGLALRPKMPKVGGLGKKLAFGAGRALGSASRMGRKGFNAVRSRIPKGIKTGVRELAKRATTVLSRIPKFGKRLPRLGGS